MTIPLLEGTPTQLSEYVNEGVDFAMDYAVRISISGPHQYISKGASTTVLDIRISHTGALPVTIESGEWYVTGNPTYRFLSDPAKIEVGGPALRLDLDVFMLARLIKNNEKRTGFVPVRFRFIDHLGNEYDAEYDLNVDKYYRPS